MRETLAELMAARYGHSGEDDFPESLPHEWPGDVTDEARETLAGLLGRSTCRRFREDPLPAGLLEMLLACAQSAPSKSDLQQYSIVVVESAQARKEIAGWLSSQPWVGAAPVFLVICGDVRRNRRVCETQQRPHANNNLDTFMNAAVDAALAMGALIASAEAAGLGTCPISGLRNSIEDATRLLDLPEGVFPIAGLCLGYPEALEPRSPRLPQDIVVHRERYREEHLEPSLADYDRRRHGLGPLPPGKQKNAQVYGVSEVCTWSDQVSRQLSIPERAGFGAFLRGRGISPD